MAMKRRMKTKTVRRREIKIKKFAMREREKYGPNKYMYKIVQYSIVLNEFLWIGNSLEKEERGQKIRNHTFLLCICVSFSCRAYAYAYTLCCMHKYMHGVVVARFFFVFFFFCAGIFVFAFSNYLPVATRCWKVCSTITQHTPMMIFVLVYACP